MEIKKSSNEFASIIVLSGRFDAHEVVPVKEWAAEQLAGGAKNLVVNLSGVNFIDSTALSILVQALKNSREKGSALRLCAFQQPVKVIFELTRLDKAFDIYPNEEEALAACKTTL